MQTKHTKGKILFKYEGLINQNKDCINLKFDNKLN